MSSKDADVDVEAQREIQEEVVENGEETSWPMTPEELVERYRGFVLQTIHRVRAKVDGAPPVAELEGYGYRGLLEAGQRYEPDRGVKFVTYAYPRVRGAVLDGLTEQRWGRQGLGCEVRDNVVDREGPTDADGAEGSTMIEETLSGERFGGLPQSVSLMSMLLVEPGTLATCAGERNVRAEEEAQMQRFRVERVEAALEELSEMEREIVVRYHVHEDTLTAIAEDLEASKSWISRLKDRAVEQVREVLEREESDSSETDAEAVDAAVGERAA